MNFVISILDSPLTGNKFLNKMECLKRALIVKSFRPLTGNKLLMKEAIENKTHTYTQFSSPYRELIFKSRKERFRKCSIWAFSSPYGELIFKSLLLYTLKLLALKYNNRAWNDFPEKYL